MADQTKLSAADRALGLGSPIARRDFIQGVAVAALAAGIPAGKGLAASVADAAAVYPPLREGMRGTHPGAFEAAHHLRDGGDFPAPKETGETYDLVVVGGGLSGLAAAAFFRQRAGNAAKILILDNHDDFGGHARRNEFRVQGKTLITTGGSAYMVAPSQWRKEALELLGGLGIDPFHKSGKAGARRGGLKTATWFPSGEGGGSVVAGSLTRPTPEFLNAAPLPPTVRSGLSRLFHHTQDPMAGLSPEEKIAKLRAMTYRDYLVDVLKLDEATLPYVQGVWCLSKTACSAWFARFRYAPGFHALGLPERVLSPENPANEADEFHFQAGNSEIARLLVRSLIPATLPEGPWQALQEHPLDYGKLDLPGNAVRVRLSSIAVKVAHEGAQPAAPFEPDNRDILVDYVTGGEVRRVRAGHAVLACNNNIIPYLCPELPAAQQAALHRAVRSPNQMTTVLLRDGRAVAKAGFGRFVCATSFYGQMGVIPQLHETGFDPESPLLMSFATGTNSGILNNDVMARTIAGRATPAGMSMQNQFRMVRMGLLNTPFSTFERAVRTQLAGTLGPAGLDPARDVLGITVNRWPHGFAMARNALFDHDPADAEPPCVVARRRFGKITIANSDASGLDLAATAIDQGFRAVRELDGQHYGYYETI